MNTVTLMAVAIASFVAAAWLHELTHAIAARALGADVLEINLVDLYVDFRFDEPQPRRERLVLLAPAIVGLAAVPVVFVVASPGANLLTAVGAIAWAIYALNGGTHGELAIRRTQPA